MSLMMSFTHTRLAFRDASHQLSHSVGISCWEELLHALEAAFLTRIPEVYCPPPLLAGHAMPAACVVTDSHGRQTKEHKVCHWQP